MKDRRRGLAPHSIWPPADRRQGNERTRPRPGLGTQRCRLVVIDPEQVILGSDPYRRLSYTWHSFTPRWAAEVGMDEATAKAWRAEPRPDVTFDMEDAGRGAVKLTVTHGSFWPGSRVLQAISEGWPAVLSSLKTLLDRDSPACHLGRARQHHPGTVQSSTGKPPCQNR
ncbi:MAG: SRPBCC domain-containing protein [Streptosporangiaceae bacterium]